MFKKIKNTFKTMSMLEDIDVNMSKIDWYNSVLTTEDIPKYNYFTQYQITTNNYFY